MFPRPEDRVIATDQPDFFVDLNCDQIVDAIVAGKDEYELKPFFYSPLNSIAAIRYRQEVMQDLEQPNVLAAIETFAGKMRKVREHLRRIRKLHYKEQKQAWFLETVGLYCAAIVELAENLSSAVLRSAGLSGLLAYLVHYRGSPRFRALAAEQKRIKDQLAAIRYSVLIKGSSFTVRDYAGETDYSEEVERTFAKFKQEGADDYRVKFTDGLDMNHVEAKILEFVARLNPSAFAALDAFCTTYAEYRDETIVAFDREVQFYVAYLGYIGLLRQAGLAFCYPVVSDQKSVYDYDGFDMALAHNLAGGGAKVVCNDFELHDLERIIVVSGPNQGGKTTFARSFGQLHYFAALGCPVPGRDAKLFHFDRLFTHFERAEKVENLRGKLEDDLIRVHEILKHATSRSIVVMNEIFTSTTLQDETFLSEKVMRQLIDRGVLGVWVTFVDELASFGPETVSMVSTVVPDNPTLRTFKILRSPANGLAYAEAIARKYGLTYDAIRKRVAP